MAQDDKRSKQLEADEAQREADKSSAQSETDRYRQAAEDALQQLDWAIGYLHGIHKLDISRALAKNRSFIRTRLMGEAEQPVPGQQTSEK
jgi:hypothetical protein